MSSRVDALGKVPAASARVRLAVAVQGKGAAHPGQWIPAASWVPWIFAAKTTASALLALLVAFTFDLDQPKWALLTVFIVAQPQSGMVLAKSFYRIIGTVVGAVVALTLVSLFAQERVLFLGTLAVWIGLCTFASRNARNFTSYGFVLSGYTVAIVGVTSALNPDNAFFVTQARVTEISLGIIATATVSHLVVPLLLADSLRRTVETARTAVAEFAIAVLEGRDTPEQRSSVLAQAIAIENLRASAVFEDRDIRLRSDALRDLAAAMLAVADIAYLLGRSLDWLREREAGGPDLQPARARSAEAVRRWRRSELDAMGLRCDLIQAAAELPLARSCYYDLVASDEEVIRRATAIGRLREFFAALLAVAEAHQVLGSPTPQSGQRVRFYLANDRVGAAWAGIRAAMALLLVGTFWILADWPSGSTATILAAVVTARLATMEQPLHAAIGGTAAVVLATLPAFVAVEVLLPAATGFETFCTVVAPFLFACSLMMGHKKTAGLGFIAALYFANTAAFENRMAYDAVAFLNISLAIALAIATAAALFASVAPETPEAARRRFVRVARRAFGRIGRRLRPIKLNEFETAMTEALDQWRRGLGSDAKVEAGVALLGIGRDLIRVRDDGQPMAENVRIEWEIARFLATGARLPLNHVRRVARDAAVARLRDLRAGRLGVLDARAASREMVAFAAIGDELERCGDLVLPDNGRTPARVA